MKCAARQKTASETKYAVNECGKCGHQDLMSERKCGVPCPKCGSIYSSGRELAEGDPALTASVSQYRTDPKLRFMMTPSRYIRFESFSKKDVNVIDIATHLANQTRYNGAVWYSVAQHAIHVEEIVRRTHPQYAFAALMHDAPEAYYGDFLTGVKQSIGLPLLKFCEEIDAIVFGAFKIPYPYPKEMADVIQKADMLALSAEVHTLLPDSMRPQFNKEFWEHLPPNPLEKGESIVVWERDMAKKSFLSRVKKCMPKKK